MLIRRDTDSDVEVCAVAGGFMCIECSLATHAGSTLLCTRREEMVQHLHEHRARGHRVLAVALDILESAPERRRSRHWSQPPR